MQREERKFLSLDEFIQQAIQAKAEAGYIYKTDENDEIVRTDGLPLSRKERRHFERIEQRRLKKLHKLKKQIEWEKTKLERAEKAKVKREVKSSN